MPGNIKIICENRKARFNYQIVERFEAGLVLQGSEVKSLRLGQANLSDAYGMIHGNEVFLLKSHIAPYTQAGRFNHDPTRMRKLLLHAHEISKLIGKTVEKGFTLVPTKLYFKEGRAKVEMALGKSKKMGDKRETIKRRIDDRQMERALKQVKR